MKPDVAGLIAFGVALVATVALLPVVAPPADPGLPSEGDMVDAASMREEGLQAPVWSRGDAWRVQFPRTDFECALVVVAGNETDGYRQGAACDGQEGLATEEAIFAYAFLGDMGPGLEGRDRDGESVTFFDWPLTDGKGWTTSWNGRELDVVATFSETLEGPDGREPGFHIEMRSEDEVFATYDYLPSLSWWSDLQLANGFQMVVQGFEPGWEGEVSTAEAGLSLALGGSTLVPLSGSFSCEAEDDLLVLVRSWDPAAVRRLSVTTPSGGNAHSETALLPSSGSSEFSVAYMPPEVGTWQVDLLHAGMGARVDVEVHAVRFTTHLL